MKRTTSMQVHANYYPTAWHYEQSSEDLSGRLPSFIVGRNPYVKLLSGYLDKLAGRDLWNRQVRCCLLPLAVVSAPLRCQLLWL